MASENVVYRNKFGVDVQDGDVINGWTYNIRQDNVGEVICSKYKLSDKVDGLKFIVFDDESGVAELDGKRIASVDAVPYAWEVIFKNPEDCTMNSYEFVDTYEDYISAVERYAEKLKGIDNDELVIDNKTQRSR